MSRGESGPKAGSRRRLYGIVWGSVLRTYVSAETLYQVQTKERFSTFETYERKKSELRPGVVQSLRFLSLGAPFGGEFPVDNFRYRALGEPREDLGWYCMGRRVPCSPKRTLRHLSIDHSSMQGSIDAEAGVTYMEWTMEVKNESNFMREAEGYLRLPRGAVVSRVTLWVNGKPEEAAFSSRG